MSTYSAPIDDMQFVVKELIGLEQISSLPGCEEATPDLIDAVIEEAGKFATGVLDPLNWPGDQHGARLDEHVVTAAPGFAEAYSQFCEAGWGALANDPQFGGQGLPHVVSALTSEMWNAACMSFALCPMLTTGAVHAVHRHGSPEQQAMYLPNLVSGKWAGTMNLTEPQAGSDCRQCAHARCRKAIITALPVPRSSSPGASTTWRRISSTWCWPVPLMRRRA